MLVAVAGGVLAGKRASAPAVERVPIDPFAKHFVYFFALAPAFVATLLAVLLGRPAPVGGAAPLVVLSGLAVIVAAGDVIRLYRQRIGALVWLGLLVVPPAVIVAATVTLPWTAAVDLEVSKPANAMGQFFAETFRRRTGKPLAIVIGDARTAALVALASPTGRAFIVDGAPERAPWLNDDASARQGRDRRLAGDRHRGHAAAGASRRAFPISSPKCRARSSGRCRAGCRCCASAGR